jgi:hypothetical protein
MASNRTRVPKGASPTIDQGLRRTGIPRNPDKWVFLRAHPRRWERLPGHVHSGLRKKRNEILAIRASIAAAAKVPVMPPVEILDVAWVGPDPEALCLGAIGVPEIGGQGQFGVVMPGASILAADTLTLRQLLLYGFRDCFWGDRQMLRQIETTGVVPEKPCPACAGADDGAEKPNPENPTDWFGEEDVRIFPHSEADFFGRPSMNSAAAIVHMWLERGLPAEPLPNCLEGPPVIQSIPLHDATIAHIRMLEARATSAPCKRFSFRTLAG